LHSFDIFGFEDADPSKPPSAKSLGSVLEDNEEPSQFIDDDGEDEDKKLKKKRCGVWVLPACLPCLDGPLTFQASADDVKNAAFTASQSNLGACIYRWEGIQEV
jgi:hypothetical protein